MKVLRVKKLFRGKISLRDYTVSELIQNNEMVSIWFNNQNMILTPEQLKQGTSNGRVFISKWGNKKYKLRDYDWKPVDQMSLI